MAAAVISLLKALAFAIVCLMHRRKPDTTVESNGKRPRSKLLSTHQVIHSEELDTDSLPESPRDPSPLISLPLELWFDIFDHLHLDYRHTKRLMLVSKDFFHIIRSGNHRLLYRESPFPLMNVTRLGWKRRPRLHGVLYEHGFRTMFDGSVNGREQCCYLNKTYPFLFGLFTAFLAPGADDMKMWDENVLWPPTSARGRVTWYSNICPNPYAPDDYAAGWVEFMPKPEDDYAMSVLDSMVVRLLLLYRLSLPSPSGAAMKIAGTRIDRSSDIQESLGWLLERVKGELLGQERLFGVDRLNSRVECLRARFKVYTAYDEYLPVEKYTHRRLIRHW